jgi:NAD-dependent deacetylase
MSQEIVAILKQATSLVVLTGAGISAESGIPTFRDALTGLWAEFRAEDLATPQAFERDPEMVARWYDQRRLNCAAARPNPGHDALARLEEHFAQPGKQFLLLTQNVDRLHQRAGSKRVLELHGSLWVWRCLDCANEAEETGPAFSDYPPRCTCGGPRRPGVVWFGEMLDPAVIDQAHGALAKCDVFISLGTSAVVEPAASFIYLAKRAGASTIEINLQPTPISDVVDYSLMGKTGEVLPKVVAALIGESSD